MSEKTRPMRCNRCGKNTVVISSTKFGAFDGRPVYECLSCGDTHTEGNPYRPLPPRGER